ncbi:hypothetical protein J699_03023 [Acinetobacter sp. 1000160]|nr:hypothetical protein J522_3605 [Acinetobacter baumannii 146457]EYT16386.1 hypothetical protein J699_03023 [Acinetobacter sp. 1000160]
MINNAQSDCDDQEIKIYFIKSIIYNLFHILLQHYNCVIVDIFYTRARVLHCMSSLLFTL